MPFAGSELQVTQTDSTCSRLAKIEESFGLGHWSGTNSRLNQKMLRGSPPASSSRDVLQLPRTSRQSRKHLGLAKP